MYDRITNKIHDPYGNHKAKSASTTDDLSLSDISYCDDDQEDIDVSLDETLTIERTKDDGARSKSYISSTKRVCKQKADPTNRKGCWGTVIECVGNHTRNKWTIHFDDKTVEYWNLNHLELGLLCTKGTK